MRKRGLIFAVAAGLALGAGGCCLDDGSDCDSDADCCSDYCDGYCVEAAKGASRAVRDPSRALAQRTSQRPQAKLSLECLKKKLAR